MTPEEQEQERRFRAYLQYTCVLSDFFASVAPGALFHDVIGSETFRSIQGGHTTDEKRIGQLLRNAWMTEVLTRLAADMPHYSHYANLWLPVQSYYSAYLALRALYLAMGRSVSNDHANTLRVIARDIEARPDLFAFPWKIVCVGNPDGGNAQYANLPSDVSVERVNPLKRSVNVDFINSYAMLLRTTRSRLIKARCEEWRHSHGTRRVPAAERQAIADRLAPTSLFDCMYRLRLRSNYADADSFLLTMELEEDALALNRAIQSITWHNALMIEMLICRYLSRRKYEPIVQHFADKERSGVAAATVVERQRIISQCCG